MSTSTGIVDTFRSGVNEFFDATIDNLEKVHTAWAPLPQSRDIDEDYTTGPQSPFAQKLEAARPAFLNTQNITQLVAQATKVDALLDMVFNPTCIDDRKNLLEQGLDLMSRLPKGLSVSRTLEDKIIALLYYDLPHPPATYISPGFAFRQADGSYNNVAFPDLGRAGTPYTRTVQGVTAMPQDELPDPGLIFDTLLRRSKFVPHPAGNSAMMFGFATLVIHTCFRTNHDDWRINDTSSYVDLSPLYGNNQQEQDMVRKKDGRGMLWNDCFHENRLLFLPPISCALLVLFCRNHNYIAEKILQINERGRWTDPPPEDEAACAAQDDEIFNTARLINCGHFGSIVFSDYLASILGTVKEANSWSLNPFNQIRKADHTFVERGQGNANSVEFNLLYRWHATISEPDEAWLEEMFKRAFSGVAAIAPQPSNGVKHTTNPATDPNNTGAPALSGFAAQISVDSFKHVSSKLRVLADKDVRTMVFANLKREHDGRFRDEDLAKILMDATSHISGAFGARHTPEIMRPVEIMTIMMSRKWGVCTLNEFRVSLGLKPYASFQEWNPNPDIWQAALKLYEQIDRLELYPGLQAEETKMPGPGAGLCPGFTVSRAILADAIALTRGDRFFTTDFTPFNYTAWGFKDCQSNPNNPGAGSTLGPLLLRTLPNSYTPDSVYTWFPMIVPSKMRDNLRAVGKDAGFTYHRPIGGKEVLSIDKYEAVDDFLGRSARGFRSGYSIKAREILEGGGYFATLDDVQFEKHRKAIQTSIFDQHEHSGKIARAISSKARRLINQKNFDLVGRSTLCVDIVKDVLNLATIHWISEEIGLPVKTLEYPRGTVFEQQADQMFKDVYSYIFLDPALDDVPALRQQAKKHANALLSYITPHLETASSFGITSLRDTLWQYLVDNRSASHDFYSRMNASGAAAGMSKRDLANDVLALATLVASELSHIFVHIVNFYLEDENQKYRDGIVAASNGDSHDGITQLENYAREALRLDPVTVGVHRYPLFDIRYPGKDALEIQKGEHVFLSLKHANVDKEYWVKPKAVDLKRLKEPRLHLGDGLAKLLGEEFILETSAHILKAVFSLKNVRRAPGHSGQLRRKVQDYYGTQQYFYLDQKHKVSLWPTSMIIQYDVV